MHPQHRVAAAGLLLVLVSACGSPAFEADTDVDATAAPADTQHDAGEIVAEPAAAPDAATEARGDELGGELPTPPTGDADADVADEVAEQVGPAPSCPGLDGALAEPCVGSDDCDCALER